MRVLCGFLAVSISKLYPYHTNNALHVSVVWYLEVMIIV